MKTSISTKISDCSLVVDTSYVTDETYQDIFFENLFTGSYASGPAIIDVNGKKFTINVSFYEWRDGDRWGSELIFDGSGPDGERLINYLIKYFGATSEDEKNYIYSEIKGEREHAEIGVDGCKAVFGDDSPACAVLDAVNNIQNEILDYVLKEVYWPQVVGGLLDLRTKEGIEWLAGSIKDEAQHKSERLLKGRFCETYEKLYGQEAPEELVEFFINCLSGE